MSADKLNRAIHILGIGNLGKYVAYHLLKPTSPSLGRAALAVTLLFHRPTLVPEWEKAGRFLQRVTPAGESETRAGCDFEVLGAASNNEGNNVPIRNLIVSTKTYMTVDALEPIKHRLDDKSHILFLQNGMGTTDEVSEKVFPDASRRPTYWAGICNAGVNSMAPFSFIHAGTGSLTVGAVVKGEDLAKPGPEPGYLVKQLLEAPGLETAAVSPGQLYRAQLLKLVVNAVINPLTAVMDCHNGELLATKASLEVVKRLVREISHVVSPLLPQDYSDAFDSDGLEAAVIAVAEKTAKNKSSMLQDVRAGRRTEIDYINGYVVKQARKLGVECPLNEFLVRQIKEGNKLTDEDILGQI